jgi:hypothetical protein
MSLVRIDSETYHVAALNKQQFQSLETCFNAFSAKESEIDLYFEYDTEESTYLTYFMIKNKKKVIEIPFLSKKDRKFYVDNLIIPEKWLFTGENAIYIINNILLMMKESITLENMIGYLKFFEFGDKK